MWRTPDYRLSRLLAIMFMGSVIYMTDNYGGILHDIWGHVSYHQFKSRAPALLLSGSERKYHKDFEHDVHERVEVTNLVEKIELL